MQADTDFSRRQLSQGSRECSSSKVIQRRRGLPAGNGRPSSLRTTLKWRRAALRPAAMGRSRRAAGRHITLAATTSFVAACRHVN